MTLRESEKNCDESTGIDSYVFKQKIKEWLANCCSINRVTVKLSSKLASLFCFITRFRDKIIV